MTEAACPLMVTVGEGLMFPTMSVSYDMVVAAEGYELVGGGGSAFCPRDSVVEVAVGGWHPTAREDAILVAAFDVPPLSTGGSPASDAVMDDLAGLRMGDGPSPLGVLLLLGDLAGNVGDDRSISGQLAWIVDEPGQGLQVDMDVD